MPRIGPTEVILVLAIILIVFGAGKLPQIAGSFGKGIREFKQSLRDDEEPQTKKTVSNEADPANK